MSKEQILIDALKNISIIKIKEIAEYEWALGRIIKGASQVLDQYTQSQQESQPGKETTYYRTVKASERLPDTVGKKYFLITSNGISMGGLCWQDKINGTKKFYDTSKPDWNFYPIENVFAWLEPIPSPESDAVKFANMERYETRLMLYKLIRWTKAVESSKAPQLIENCEKILQKWSKPSDALK